MVTCGLIAIMIIIEKYTCSETVINVALCITVVKTCGNALNLFKGSVCQ
jgi:hypothetical protein